MKSKEHIDFLAFLEHDLPRGAVECRSPDCPTLMLCRLQPSPSSTVPATCQCSRTIWTDPTLEGRPICRACFILSIDPDLIELTE